MLRKLISKVVSQSTYLMPVSDDEKRDEMEIGNEIKRVNGGTVRRNNYEWQARGRTTRTLRIR